MYVVLVSYKYVYVLKKQNHLHTNVAVLNCYLFKPVVDGRSKLSTCGPVANRQRSQPSQLQFLGHIASN